MIRYILLTAVIIYRRQCPEITTFPIKINIEEDNKYKKVG